MYRKTYKDLVRKQVIFESLIASRLLASTCYRASILTSRLYSEALNKRIGRINASLLHLECKAFSAEYNFILKERGRN